MRGLSSSSILQELDILYGFLAGIWLYSSATLQQGPMAALALITGVVPIGSSIIFWVITFAFIIGSFIAAYSISKMLGIIAITFSFLGGIFSGKIGWFLLVFGAILGFLAPKYFMRLERVIDGKQATHKHY